MDREAYDAKVTTMLSDSATYKPVTKDFTATLQRRMNALLLSLRRSNHISESLTADCAAQQDASLYYMPSPKFTSLKPFSDLVSFVSSPTYQLSKHLSKIFSPTSW